MYYEIPVMPMATVNNIIAFRLRRDIIELPAPCAKTKFRVFQAEFEPIFARAVGAISLINAPDVSPG